MKIPTSLTSQLKKPPSAFVITSLSMGGAQKVLLQLLDSKLSADFPPVCVIVLRRVIDLEAQFVRLNIPLIYLELERPWRTPGRLIEAVRLLKAHKVCILYSVMHHANLCAVLLRFFVGKHLRVVWSLHDTPLEGLYTRWDHRFLFWLTVKFSTIPERIVLVSARSRRRYIEQKYPLKQLHLIPNGVAIRLNSRAQITAIRGEVRAELGLSPNAILVGSLTRYVVEKDIPCMLRAFKRFCANEPDAFLLLAGEGMTADNAELAELLFGLGLDRRVLLLGVRSDAPRLLSAMDIATLSSRSEAMPLFIAEAMAAGVPCVASEVGDIPQLLGEAGYLVPPENPQALATGWHKVLALSGAERWHMVTTARERIRTEFGVERMVARHRDLFGAIA